MSGDPYDRETAVARFVKWYCSGRVGTITVASGHRNLAITPWQQLLRESVVSNHHRNLVIEIAEDVAEAAGLSMTEARRHRSKEMGAV